MTSVGFGLFISSAVLLITVVLLVMLVFSTIQLWKKTALSQKFFGVGLILTQFFVLDVTLDLLTDGWRWSTLLLFFAQVCFMAFFFEPLRLRQVHDARLMAEMGKETPNKED